MMNLIGYVDMHVRIESDNIQIFQVHQIPQAGQIVDPTPSNRS